MSRFVATAANVYSHLLYLCPIELRAEFGKDMTLVFADDLADSIEHGGAAAGFRVCFHTAAELARHAALNLLSVHGVLTSLIVSALATICFAAELAAARAYAPTPISTAPAYVSLLLVLIPSGAAAFIAFIATRLGLRATPQRFLN